MTSIAVDFLVAVLAVICLYQAKLATPGSSTIHADYLSVESGKNLRGILSMVIVFHHLAQNNIGFLLFSLFSKLGYLTVSVFFFLSGYGLMKQHIQRENYHKQFLLRRLPTVLIPYLVITVLYWVLHQILGSPWTVKDILLGILKGEPIVTGSWYIICIVMFYIAFRFLMYLCGKRYTMMIPGGIVFCGLYVLFCIKMEYAIWWYNSVPVLILGMYWALYEQRINQFFQKNYRTATPSTFLLFAAVYGVKIILNPYICNTFLAVLFAWCTVILFVCCILLILMKLKLGNSLLRWLGEISLETYLSHYFFITLLRSDLITVPNDFLYAILVILCSLIFAQILHLVNHQLLKVYKKILGL